MASVSEALGAPGNLAASLKAGLESLDLGQTVVFTKYVRLVLPLDGFVFWVRADLLSQGALFNASRLNAVTPNQGPKLITPAAITTVNGSFHYATDQRQEEVSTYGNNRVVFTSETEVQDFNQIGPSVLLIAVFDGIKFAFSTRGSFYKQADLYHYSGIAVHPQLESQLVDALGGFDTQNVVVSNSLPIWLSLVNNTPWPMLNGLSFPLFPSFAIPANTPPPYAAVHVLPESTRALGSAPLLDSMSNHSQLVSEKVRITTYGLRNSQALDFQDYIFLFSELSDVIGIMGMPVFRDDKEIATELSALAMRKTIEFEISYYQYRANSIARQLILSAQIGLSLPDDIVPTAIFYNDGGLLVIVEWQASYPYSPVGLNPGDVWSDGGAVAITPGIVPNPAAPPVYFPAVTPLQLLLSGAGNLPLSAGPSGSGLLWNNGGFVAVS